MVGAAHTCVSGLTSKEASMRFNHLHIPVRDLRSALDWLARVWDIRPSFETEGMAVLSLHGTSLILDAADEDGSATIGFASADCDGDYRLASDHGAEALEVPEDRPWGVRAAYLRGPGRIIFEIEQQLSSAE
jgi:catechol 2,3-dioxygenase-like lactoylglutathione lyase family enzyme